MKEPKINLEKEYLLPHEILKALRWVGTSISRAGTEEKGYVPINILEITTCRMHYGTLTDFLNSSILGKPILSKANLLREKIMTDKEINQKIYSLTDVQTALEFLESARDIDIERVGKGEDSSSKVIKLTDVGLFRLADKSYLKYYLKERDAERTYNSTLWTNRMMIFFTFILAVSAGIDSYKFFSSLRRHTGKADKHFTVTDKGAANDSVTSVRDSADFQK
jgi:hypothetical protein